MAKRTIKYGDTLGGIATETGNSVDTLARLNNIKDVNKIQAGTTLDIPGSVPPPPTAPAQKVPMKGEQTAKQREAAFRDAGQRPFSSPVSNVAPVTTADMERGTSLPDASTFATSQQPEDISTAISSLATQTLSSTGVAIDALLAQQGKTTTVEKNAAQTKVDEVTGKIKTLGESQGTAAQDSLKTSRELFQTEQTIKDLKSIQTKIVSAQEALNIGLIFEKNRPARQQLLIGRSASLKAQGLATIGALQSTAQILQGNVDLAESYANTTIDAITTDNENSMKALNTLLGLYNDSLVTLEGDEKDVLEKRISALETQDKEIKQNSKDVFNLMQKYPSAAISGGVTLLDDRSTAIKKMLPKMSSMEMAKFNLDIAKGVKTKTDKDGPSEDKQQMLGLKANGMTYQEALNAFSDTLSVSWINDVYRQPDPKAVTAENQLLNAYYGTFLENGQVKEGFNVGVDKKGRPVVETDKGSSAWWKPWTWGN